MDRTTARFADFAADLRCDGLTSNATHTIRRILIDTLGCAMGGFDSAPATISRAVASRRTGTPAARILGSPIRSTPEAASFATAASIRYLDANDMYQGAAGAGHPSDMFGAIIAAGDVAHATFGDIQLGMTIAYEVFGALADKVYTRGLGWDQGVYIAPAVAAGAGKILGLTREQIGEAISIAATAYVPTRQSREGALAMWKGCATAAAAQGGLWAALLAGEGMTGPVAAYEGPRGIWEQVTGQFSLDTLPVDGQFTVERISHKRFPAEFHSQGPSAVIVEFRKQFELEDLEEVHVQIYNMAYGEIGSGPEKWDPQTRETADHSLPYLLAVAMRDGDITPASFTPERVADPALRPLMAKIRITENDEFTQRYPAELNSQIDVRTKSGKQFSERLPYPRGHANNPLTDADIESKFRALSRAKIGEERCDKAIDLAWNLQANDCISPLLDLFEVP